MVKKKKGFDLPVCASSMPFLSLKLPLSRMKRTYANDLKNGNFNIFEEIPAKVSPLGMVPLLSCRRRKI